ncbi:winged helix-turn-helix domain-containing protein [Psychroserpens algicola]|uniref:Winged helix-turn-helix domain-containing protein n=1 Tax=Psychroserpens algicola TaxID=1719034 RepID=A0ABT0HAI9_9FLAO|nr:winged helix-turn-helix domain-containing protein [Psychroserpens algicola]MCK8481388.1 winged helix-turn-helix domain-containing protein [Psychroserpens algicola]
MKQQQLYSLSAVIIFLFVCSFIACDNTTTAIDDSSKIKIALREAGNQLLLQQQDSTSIILPVVKKDASTYQLSFQNSLSFEPNELVTVIDSSFAIMLLSKNYRVEAIQCTDNEVAYSYEMNVEEERTIIPCAGRYLPEDCYTIEVTFLDARSTFFNRHPLLYVILFGAIIFIGYYFREKRLTSESSHEALTNYSEIGSFQFYPEQNKLVKSATEINLSKKECELLELLVARPNQIITREELTKKVWEDNGVIVGRSLDTYISKLRKKLKGDDTIKLTNVHGIGYKLEVNKT